MRSREMIMAGNVIDVKRESRNLPSLCSTTIFFILYKKTQVHGSEKKERAEKHSKSSFAKQNSHTHSLFLFVPFYLVSVLKRVIV